MKYNVTFGEETSFDVTFSNTENLNVNLESEEISEINLEEDLYFDADFSSDDMDFNSDFGEVQIIYSGELPLYTGPTIVTPKFEVQTLETQHTDVEDNIVILEIPYSEVHNPSNGITINIGDINGQ